MTPTYPIETDRLTLRPFVEADYTDALAYHTREDVARYLPWETPTAETFPDAFATKCARTRLDREGDVLTLAVVPHDVGHVVGDMTFFWRSEVHRGGEIGFAFHPDHQGRGYATEASRVLLDLAFGEMGLHRVVGRLDARNKASAAVLERLGMRLEAHLVQNEWFKGEWSDELVYAVLEREWAARQL